MSTKVFSFEWYFLIMFGENELLRVLLMKDKFREEDIYNVYKFRKTVRAVDLKTCVHLKTAKHIDSLLNTVI